MSDDNQSLKEKIVSLTENELERFRQDWLSEVNQKTSQASNKLKYTNDSGSHKIQKQSEVSSNTLEESQEALASLVQSSHDIKSLSDGQRHQVALELYKEAVSDEKKGKLGEALGKYRRAFKLDPDVDLSYRAYYRHLTQETGGNPEQSPFSGVEEEFEFVNHILPF
ncbi:hypothetical protein DSO57_1007986 [Entomophthora muscae]|uniref:Uncharacterized protein n=1 Tax=Entomophthora muscae TaxID=34485 RepID=A0ACC2TIF4_9FUNG|nr:hypothetical protein DSO57_1007986 [Entomophthora muscae]